MRRERMRNGNQSNKGNDMFIELEQWWVHDSKWKKLQGTEELHLWVEKREPKTQIKKSEGKYTPALNSKIFMVDQARIWRKYFKNRLSI